MGTLLDSAHAFVNDWKVPGNVEPIRRSITVVVPVFRPSHFGQFIDHLLAVSTSIVSEVILVDDSGQDSGDLSRVVSRVGSRVRMVRHSENLGRPAARNTGAAFAKSDILVFLDQDMFVPPSFFSHVLSTMSANQFKAVVLGMRTTSVFENISVAKPEAWQEVDLSEDWRHYVVAHENMIDLTVTGEGLSFNRCQRNGSVNIHALTGGFRSLGTSPASIVGYWDLPSMVASHSMAIDSDTFRRFGGFPEWICGWGGEDIALGFKAVASHVPIVPLLAVSRQAAHKPYSGSEAAKVDELRRNLLEYRRWAGSADAMPSWPGFEYFEARIVRAASC